MPATQPARRPVHLLPLLAAALLLVLLAGCASAPQDGTGPASVDRAERLLRQGNPAAAAQMYERLAESNPQPDRNTFALASARAWLAANRADDAQRMIDFAGPGTTLAQRFERDLLYAEVAMARGQYGPAWQQISQVAEPDSPADAARLFQLQQQVALRAAQPVEAVRAGIARERVAGSEADRTRARRDLLSDLRGAIDRGLRINAGAAPDALVRGWFEIAEIAADAGRSPLSAEAAIQRWRGRYPGHPASTIAESDILHAAEAREPGTLSADSRAPIALLLPLTGAAGTDAALVRDGFMASMTRMPAADRPAVRVYDTGAMSVGAALNQARSDGAGFIVGPLTRDEVLAAYEQRPTGLPLLLLNSLPSEGFPGGNVYQYALAPEDEARQIARQIVNAAQRRVLVLAPSDAWGQRVSRAFADELTRAGGVVVAQGDYDLARNNLGTVLTRVLGIDASRDRHRRIQQVTGATLATEVQPRPDIDAIFVAGWQSLALRQINPQLRHFNADRIPAYVTQDGLADDALSNRDLLGMQFVDMPWLLDSIGPVADLRSATEGQWASRGFRRSRLFAFGHDAATLAMTLRRGTNVGWPLPGLTGRLQLTPEGRVERGLNWARLSESGSVQTFDPINR